MGGRRVGGLGRVGPYTMVERLGRGGMGEVYLAIGRRGVKVAVKILRDPIGDDPESRLRLDREVRALRRVESPYVARVLDADLSGDRPYLVMEHIEGETLLDAVRRGGPLSGPQLIDLARGLATAIAIIHAAGVIHRDVKPANVVLGPDGPVLIDFGIAQVSDATRLTMTGTFLGTPGYSAPEVFAEEAVGEPSDVHSWAASVAFAATGRPTFGRGTVEAQMYAVLNGRADLAGVPGALLPLIRAALHREPAKRPTAALLSDRLSRLARATAPAGSPAGGTRGDEPPPSARTRADGTPAGRGKADDAAGARAREDTPAGERARGEEPAAGRLRGEAAEPAGNLSPAARKQTPAARRVPRTAATGERVRVRGPKADAAERRAKAEGAERRATGEGGRVRRAATDVKESLLAAEAVRGASVSSPPGSAVLIMLAMLAVPCVVASVIWPLATFIITAAFCVLARAWWSGHWLVRNRRSARVRASLRVVSFPVTLAGSVLSAAVWPGLPASAIAASAFWVAAGGSMEGEWWVQPGPMTVAGVVFGVVCGGIVGREVERVGVHVPELRREGLRALSVLGGFVALCAAAVRVLAWVLPHAF
ncbi:serine/threonine-protein kinase [Sphaerisporangium perillae]|uniref:serine/threonine-protein kinase n=1 Tax=Sphaerisporangium perillae TaxID=2935860 RepID=UPI00200E85BD|nr:serine/threonine-protein kinase [Sphaerisporangium perillae]